MPWHKEESLAVYSPRSEFKYAGGFKNAVVVVSNLVSRASTKWSLDEGKLFMLAVSQIENRDEECWVRMRKKDIIVSLGLNPNHHCLDLRKKLLNVKNKSRIELVGATEDDWESGDLVRRIKTDRYYVYVQFDDYYLPLLHYVKDTLFTKFEVQNLLGLKHKSSYNLYLYLTSWHNANYQINKRNINKTDLPKVFNLSEGQYWRNYGTDLAKFHWSDFEKKCLIPAVEGINSNPTCDMHIWKYQKIKDPSNNKTVLGYAFEWSYVNPDGSPKIRKSKPALPDPEKYLSIEAQNYIHSFMQHFQRLNDRKLKLLSLELGSNAWNEQVAWSVGELKQEASQKCISAQLYDHLIHVIGFDSDGYEKFADLFGYEDPNTLIRDLDSIGLKHRLD